jgi:hypothetical protein
MHTLVAVLFADFAERLNRLREGRHTKEDIGWFKKHMLITATHSPTPDIPRLFYSNKDVDEYNNAEVERITNGKSAAGETEVI